MAIISSKEFNQRASAILKLSETEPVYITKWGKIVSILTNYQHYQAQIQPKTLASAFAQTQITQSVSEAVEQQFEQALCDIRREHKMNTVDLTEW